MERKIIDKIIKSIGLLIVSIVLFIIVVPALKETEEVCIEATITDIIKTTNNGKESYKIYIEYATEEGIQEDMIEENTNDKKEGDVISINCKIEKKYDLISDGLIGTIIFMILCGLLGIVGIMKSILQIHKEKIEKKLQIEGTPVIAPIKQIDCKEPFLLKSHPKQYTIICNWKDSHNNQEYIFKSKPFLYNPTKYIKNQNFNAFYVKINEQNPKQYVMDTNIIEELRNKDLDDWKITFRKFERKEITIEEYAKKRKEVFEEDS